MHDRGLNTAMEGSETEHLGPASSPRRSDLASFAGGTAAYQAGRLLLTLVAASALGPVVFGDWVLITLLLMYSSATSLGVTNGAGREIPFLAGAGRHDEATRIADVSAGATILSGIAAAAIATLIAGLLLTDATPLSIGLVAAAAALQHPFLLQQVLFRSQFAFNRAAAQLAILGIATLVTGVALVGFGITGLLLALNITYVVALLLGARLLPRPMRPRFGVREMRALISIGSPIMLAGLLYGLLTTMDRWLVASFLGRADVGYYGLVGLAVSGMLLVSQLFSQQFYPRMAFAYGAGHDQQQLLGMARSQGLLASAFVATGAVLAGTAALFGIPRFLPEYELAIPPMLIGLAGSVAYAFGSGYGNVLNTVGAHRRFLVIQTLAVAVNMAVALGLLAIGGRLEAVALAGAFGMGLYSIMLYWAAQPTGRHAS